MTVIRRLSALALVLLLLTISTLAWTTARSNARALETAVLERAEVARVLRETQNEAALLRAEVLMLRRQLEEAGMTPSPPPPAVPTPAPAPTRSRPRRASPTASPVPPPSHPPKPAPTPSTAPTATRSPTRSPAPSTSPSCRLPRLPVVGCPTG